MKCIEVEKHLDAFFDGEIVSSKEIEAHLENCVSCRISFENLGAIRRTLKQNFAVSAPSLLGEKVLSAFQNHHEAKRGEKERQTEKLGWFGIPRFAFAAALILFTLATISAFQIGRMSVGERIVMMPQVAENKSLANNPAIQENSNAVKIVEVPVIKEKMVEVPVIKEKIVTKKIYIKQESAFEDTDKSNKNEENTALNENKANNEYLTPIELEGFQPVAKIKARITKNSEVNINYEK